MSITWTQNAPTKHELLLASLSKESKSKTQENRLSMSQSTATLPETRIPTFGYTDAYADQGSALATRVAHQARQRLGNTSYHFLRFVDCCFQNGVLTLSGRVPSFYLKQMAQTVLANIEGVDRIDNRVDVVSPRGLSSVR